MFFFIYQKNQIKKIRVSSEGSETSSDQPDNGIQETPQSTCSLLNEFLNSIEVESEGENSEEEDEPELRLATIEIHGYSPKPIDVNVNIMNYWEEKKYTYPRLYRLAKVLHSVPATQVSVERAFSALKLVMTDLRCNLSSESLKKIMFLKLNK